MVTVFVSYSRMDRAFVEQLCSALRESGQDVWIDDKKIPPWADWRAGIERGIEGADSIAFVISPDSLASEACRHELDHALEHGKPIVPVLRRDPTSSAMPDALAHRRWIAVRDGEDFDDALRSLVAAIECR